MTPVAPPNAACAQPTSSALSSAPSRRKRPNQRPARQAVVLADIRAFEPQWGDTRPTPAWTPAPLLAARDAREPSDDGLTASSSTASRAWRRADVRPRGPSNVYPLMNCLRDADASSAQAAEPLDS